MILARNADSTRRHLVSVADERDRSRDGAAKIHDRR
jgi:hypothetical protein